MSVSDPQPAAEEERPHDTRLLPVAAGAWGAMLAATWCSPAVLAGLGLAVACFGALAAWRRWWRYVATALVVLGCLASGGMRAATLEHDALRGLARQHATVEVEAEVSGEPRALRAGAGRSGVAVPVTVLAIDGRGRAYTSRVAATVLASGDAVPGWETTAVGSRQRFLAVAEPPQPGEPIAAVLRVRSAPVQLSGPSVVLGGVERIRAGLRDAVRHQPDEPAGLLPALVLGDTSRVPDSLGADFKVTALTHLSAVSGASLAMLVGFVLVIARLIGVRGWSLRVLTAGCVVAFVVLCRGEPSVLRAAAMGTVTLAALGSGARDGAGLRSLCVAAIALLFVDPWLSRSWGFALSVAATLGIIWWGRRWTAALGSWLPRALAEPVCVSLAAQVATQPLVTALSGNVSPAGLLCNVMAGPFVGPATILGIATAIVSLLAPWAARITAHVACWCAQAIIWVAHWGASLPGATVHWPTSPPALLLITVACLLLGLSMERLLRRSWAVILLALLVVSTLLRGPVSAGWPPSRWDVVLCDVGQGDALVANAGRGAGVVVDTGPDPAALKRCLDALEIVSVPLLVLTHDHADHAGGLAAVLGRAPLQVLESPVASSARSEIEARVRAAGAQPRDASPGERVEVGAVAWDTISVGGGAAPASSGEGESSAENDASIIGVVQVGQLRVLMTGDVEPAGQRAALDSGRSLRADVLKVPHHGSSRQDQEMLGATGAGTALISVGARNDYGHPTQKTLRTLEGLGMTVVRTDESGALAVAKDGGAIRLTAEHEPRAVAPKRPAPARTTTHSVRVPLIWRPEAAARFTESVPGQDPCPGTHPTRIEEP